MAKRKLTPEILELIELCAEDAYTLDEIKEEADIAKPLMDNLQVLEAIERGRIKQFIEIMSTDNDIDIFMDYADKTSDDIKRMHEDHREAIECRKTEIKEEKQRIHHEKKVFAKRMLYPAGVSAMNVAHQMSENEQNSFSNETLRHEIKVAAKKLQEGESTALLEVLVGNIHQLHLFNGHIAQNIMGELGKQLPSFEKLSNMQLKVMQETRKSIMAINEISNPKRTTFIKEASQHNHLHHNSEKKDANKNELQNPDMINESEAVSDAELIPSEEGKSDNKFT